MASNGIGIKFKPYAFVGKKANEVRLAWILKTLGSIITSIFRDYYLL